MVILEKTAKRMNDGVQNLLANEKFLKRLIKGGIIFGIASFVIYSLLSAPFYTRFQHTCALCRHSRTMLKGPFGEDVTESATNCSDWYNETFPESHQHVWISAPDFAILNWLGEPCGGGSPASNRTILWKLSPEQQLAIYQQFDDSQEARRLFTRIAELSEAKSYQESDKAKLLVFALKQWQEEGFRETWSEVVQRERLTEAIEPSTNSALSETPR